MLTGENPFGAPLGSLKIKGGITFVNPLCLPLGEAQIGAQQFPRCRWGTPPKGPPGPVAKLLGRKKDLGPSRFVEKPPLVGKTPISPPKSAKSPLAPVQPRPLFRENLKTGPVPMLKKGILKEPQKRGPNCKGGKMPLDFPKKRWGTKLFRNPPKGTPF